MVRYYKGKYIIAFYDRDDNFVDVFDNVQELARITGKTQNFWLGVFSRTEVYFDGELRPCRFKDRACRFAKVNGMKCRIHFISAIEG